jgi:hypothetical protein
MPPMQHATCNMPNFKDSSQLLWHIKDSPPWLSCSFNSQLETMEKMLTSFSLKKDDNLNTQCSIIYKKNLKTLHLNVNVICNKLQPICNWRVIENKKIQQ